MIKIYLHKGKEKPVRQHHYWIFSGAIHNKNGDPENGSIVEVCDSEGGFLAYGYYNSNSKIVVRLLEWEKATVINDHWWKEKIQNALKRREDLFKDNLTNSFRLIYSEADQLPGLIVDKYNDYLVCQFLTLGIDVRKNLVIDILSDLLNPTGIYERSDAAGRTLEGLNNTNGLLKGIPPTSPIKILEDGLTFLVNIEDGQKSGHFLDQRENRKILSSFVKNKTLLDCFCYSGGFSVYAYKEGAKTITCIDSSTLAIKSVAENFKCNAFEMQNVELIEHDVFDFLRQAKQQEKHWDVIILDPPKLAPTRRSIEKAQRAYKDLNLQALKLMRPGDLLATFSCSGAIAIDLFKQIIAWAATDAGKEVQIIHQFCQPADHPINISFPESEYLKGLLCRVI